MVPDDTVLFVVIAGVTDVEKVVVEVVESVVVAAIVVVRIAVVDDFVVVVEAFVGIAII